MRMDSGYEHVSDAHAPFVNSHRQHLAAFHRENSFRFVSPEFRSFSICFSSQHQPKPFPTPLLFFLRNVTKDELHLGMLKCVIKCINMQCSTFCTLHHPRVAPLGTTHHLHYHPPRTTHLSNNGGFRWVLVSGWGMPVMGTCEKSF